MPVYTYRREDGTTFDYRQKFSDDPLKVDPASGQRVVRVVQAAGVIFKGSGFYVNDSKSASKASVNGTSKPGAEGSEKPAVKEVTKETSTVGAAAD
jgi:putative FmdB family regulatory protein